MESIVFTGFGSWRSPKVVAYVLGFPGCSNQSVVGLSTTDGAQVFAASLPGMFLETTSLSNGAVVVGFTCDCVPSTDTCVSLLDVTTGGLLTNPVRLGWSQIWNYFPQPDGSLIVVEDDDINAMVVKLSSRLDVLWNYTTSDPSTLQRMATAPTVAATSAFVYASVLSKYMLGIDFNTGKGLWGSAFPQLLSSWVAPDSSEAYAIYGSFAIVVSKIDPTTGSKIWTTRSGVDEIPLFEYYANSFQGARATQEVVSFMIQSKSVFQSGGGPQSLSIVGFDTKAGSRVYSLFSFACVSFNVSPYAFVSETTAYMLLNCGNGSTANVLALDVISGNTLWNSTLPNLNIESNFFDGSFAIYRNTLIVTLLMDVFQFALHDGSLLNTTTVPVSQTDSIYPCAQSNSTGVVYFSEYGGSAGAVAVQLN